MKTKNQLTHALLPETSGAGEVPKNETLRKRAEKRLATRGNGNPVSPVDAIKLVHELQVHQIELEMQNEELKLANAAAEEARTQFSDLYDFAPAGYVTLDEKGTIWKANLTFSRLTGFDRGYMLEKPFHHFVAREEKNAFSSSFKHITASDAGTTFETGIVKKDNTVFNALVESIVFRDRSGAGQQFLLAILDITERKTMEKQIRLDQSRIEGLLKISQYKAGSNKELLEFALGEAIALTGSETGYICSFNDATKKLTIDICTSRPAGGDKTVYLLENTGIWGDAVRRAGPVIVNDTHASPPLKKDYPREYTVLRKFLTVPVILNGRTAGVVGVSNANSDYGGNDALQLSLFMGSAWQILERHKVQDLLRIRSEELSLANKELETFSYSVSHDLLNPVQAIMTCIAVIDKDPESILGKKSTTALEYVATSARHMAQSISDLLTLSRIGGPDLLRVTTDLSVMARNICSELKSIDPARNIMFSIQPDCSAHADEGLVKILLGNLLTNAWKFTGTREKASVEFGMSDAAHRTTYFVRDNGVGFSMAHADKLFRPFERLHSDKEFKGTGIGLSIVKRIVEKHGGTVWAESEKDKGATFFFRLGQPI